jgi:hypothetical protein
MNPEALRRLLEVVQLLQLHREVSERFLAGDTSLAPSRAHIALWVAQQLERRLPPQCSGFMKSGWRLLARMTRKRSISTHECDALHALLIRQYLAAERLPRGGRRAAPQPVRGKARDPVAAAGLLPRARPAAPRRGVVFPPAAADCTALRPADSC